MPPSSAPPTDGSPPDGPFRAPLAPALRVTGARGALTDAELIRWIASTTDSGGLCSFDLRENLVRNIMAYGVLQPVTVREQAGSWEGVIWLVLAFSVTGIVLALVSRPLERRAGLH